MSKPMTYNPTERVFTLSYKEAEKFLERNEGKVVSVRQVTSQSVKVTLAA